MDLTLLQIKTKNIFIRSQNLQIKMISKESNCNTFKYYKKINRKKTATHPQ